MNIINNALGLTKELTKIKLKSFIPYAQLLGAQFAEMRNGVGMGGGGPIFSKSPSRAPSSFGYSDTGNSPSAMNDFPNDNMSDNSIPDDSIKTGTSRMTNSNSTPLERDVNNLSRHLNLVDGNVKRNANRTNQLDNVSRRNSNSINQLGFGLNRINESLLSVIDNTDNLYKIHESLLVINDTINTSNKNSYLSTRRSDNNFRNVNSSLLGIGDSINSLNKNTQSNLKKIVAFNSTSTLSKAFNVRDDGMMHKNVFNSMDISLYKMIDILEEIKYSNKGLLENEGLNSEHPSLFKRLPSVMAAKIKIIENKMKKTTAGRATLAVSKAIGKAGLGLFNFGKDFIVKPFFDQVSTNIKLYAKSLVERRDASIAKDLKNRINVLKKQGLDEEEIKKKIESGEIKIRDHGLIGYLGKMFSKPKGLTSSSVYESRLDQQFDSVPFDNETRDSIVNGIPLLLSKILQAVSGKELYYSYATGKLGSSEEYIDAKTAYAKRQLSIASSKFENRPWYANWFFRRQDVGEKTKEIEELKSNVDAQMIHARSAVDNTFNASKGYIEKINEDYNDNAIKSTEDLHNASVNTSGTKLGKILTSPFKLLSKNNYEDVGKFYPQDIANRFQAAAASDLNPDNVYKIFFSQFVKEYGIRAGSFSSLADIILVERDKIPSIFAIYIQGLNQLIIQIKQDKLKDSHPFTIIAKILSGTIDSKSGNGPLLVIKFMIDYFKANGMHYESKIAKDVFQSISVIKKPSGINDILKSLSAKQKELFGYTTIVSGKDISVGISEKSNIFADAFNSVRDFFKYVTGNYNIDGHSSIIHEQNLENYKRAFDVAGIEEDDIIRQATDPSYMKPSSPETSYYSLQEQSTSYIIKIYDLLHAKFLKRRSPTPDNSPDNNDNIKKSNIVENIKQEEVKSRFNKLDPNNIKNYTLHDNMKYDINKGTSIAKPDATSIYKYFLNKEENKKEKKRSLEIYGFLKSMAKNSKKYTKDFGKYFSWMKKKNIFDAILKVGGVLLTSLTSLLGPIALIAAPMLRLLTGTFGLLKFAFKRIPFFSSLLANGSDDFSGAPEGTSGAEMKKFWNKNQFTNPNGNKPNVNPNNTKPNFNPSNTKPNITPNNLNTKPNIDLNKIKPGVDIDKMKPKTPNNIKNVKDLSKLSRLGLKGTSLALKGSFYGALAGLAIDAGLGIYDAMNDPNNKTTSDFIMSATKNTISNATFGLINFDKKKDENQNKENIISPTGEVSNPAVQVKPENYNYEIQQIDALYKNNNISEQLLATLVETKRQNENMIRVLESISKNTSDIKVGNNNTFLSKNDDFNSFPINISSSTQQPFMPNINSNSSNSSMDVNFNVDSINFANS